MTRPEEVSADPWLGVAREHEALEALHERMETVYAKLEALSRAYRNNANIGPNDSAPDD